jgi:hypothetical protein
MTSICCILQSGVNSYGGAVKKKKDALGVLFLFVKGLLKEDNHKSG